MTYPGGKNGSGIYQKLINLMPPHSVYIEAFLGGGALMRMKKPAALNIGIDLDAGLIARWKASTAKGVVPAERWILPPEMSVAAETVRSGVGRSHHAGNGVRRRQAPPSAARLAGTAGTGVVAGGIGRNGGADRHARTGGRDVFEFHCADGIEFLRSYQFTGSELVYCDPPYLLSSRTSCDEDYYRREMSDVQHRELLRVLRKLGCRVMLSGYSSHLYDLHLKGWNSITYMAPTRRGMREEWLWFNYERPVELHDYRYLGENYRERENLWKQQRRWKAKLERMPLQQRQALLSAIADTARSAVGPPTALRAV